MKKQITTLQSDIANREEVLQRRWSDEVEFELQNKKQLLHQLLGWEAKLLFQQTRMQWISEGDKNSKFFHALIRGRRARNKITLQGEDGTLIKEPQIIGDKAAIYFGGLFTASRY